MWFALLTFLNMGMQKKHYTAIRIVYPAQKPNNSVFLSKLTQWISVLFTAKSLGHWQSAAGEMMYGYFFRWAWSLLEEPAGVKEGAGQLVPVGASWWIGAKQCNQHWKYRTTLTRWQTTDTSFCVFAGSHLPASITQVEESVIITISWVVKNAVRYFLSFPISGNLKLATRHLMLFPSLVTQML